MTTTETNALNINATVRVSKQERILYGEDWAPLVRRLGDAAQALEEARSIAELRFEEARREDGITGGERNEHGRSEETERRFGILELVAGLEQSALKIYRGVAGSCSTHNEQRRLVEPSTCADASRAPEVAVG